ncbi:MAG: putative thiamine biosynthesis protein [bacterium ADurb.Bin429]|nr:MAG: putative thiamine biosynthesis protein [bacterium ADurb.Bin429]
MPGISRKLNRLMLTGVLCIGFLAILTVAMLRSRPSPATMEEVTIAWAPFEPTALLCIADDRGFFSQNGLKVAIRRYDTGAATIDGIVRGDADISVGASEYPLVGQAFRKAPVRILGSIGKSEIIYLVARRDRGINTAADLKGKRVGTTVGTVADFFLGRYLELHGMTARDIARIDIKTPEGWVNAVAEGEIDAIATAQPSVNAAKTRLGTNAAVWKIQSSQPLYSLVTATSTWITRHPEAVNKFFAAMAQAEEFTVQHPAAARAIVRKRFNLEAGYLETVWTQNQFALSLEQSLILAMEDEARWMMKNKLTPDQHVPDFLAYISEDALKAIKPNAVHIIR